MILLQLNLTKVKLEYLKSGFKGKKERHKLRRKFFTSLKFDFFRVQLKFAFRIRRMLFAYSVFFRSRPSNLFTWQIPLFEWWLHRQFTSMWPQSWLWR